MPSQMSVMIKCERPYGKNDLKQMIERYDRKGEAFYHLMNAITVNLNIVLVAVAVHQWIHNAYLVLYRTRLNLFAAIRVLLHHANWNQNLIVVHLCQSPACHVRLDLHSYLASHALSFVHPAQVTRVLPVHLYLNQSQLLMKPVLFSGHLLLLVDYFTLEQSGVIRVYHMLVEPYLAYFAPQSQSVLRI